MSKLNNTSNKKQLISALVRNAEGMIQAGLSKTTRTCGTPSCSCHVDPSRRHGPHAYLTFRSPQEKSSSLYVPPEHLEEALEAKHAWDKFWEAATALAAINREELKQRWQRARKAKVKR
jgi:Family of unknown function (DUF6788)